MQDHIDRQELQERLTLIENMINEGRRATQSCGWLFVLWGVAYYAAFAWSEWGHSEWAWPATMLGAVIVTIVGASVKGGRQPDTTNVRAIGSIWMATGTSMFLLFLALGSSGRLSDQHIFFAAISAMLGVANGASGMILRWRVQMGCAVIWWVAAVVTCFGSDTRSAIVFLVAIFLCQIVFGIYGMTADAQKLKRHGTVHA